MTDDPPRSFRSATDTYLVERDHLSGGMGTTFVVRSENTGERLLLKQLRLDRAARWKNVERFEREAKVLQALDHASIPRYVDFIPLGESVDGDLAIVQEYVEGRTLQSYIDDDVPMATGDLERHLRQLLDVLTYLHGLVPPVIHRDISPKNVIISGERAYLIDFGAVRLAAANPSETVTSVGTFGYMAPEQIMGQATEPSDLFSLGMTFVAVAAHADPSELQLDEESGRVDVRKALESAHLPEKLIALLEKMTEPGLGSRAGNASDALHRLTGDREPATVPARAPQDPDRRNKTRKWRLRIAATYSAAALLLVLTAGWGLSLRMAPGEVGRFGGWFTGHGSFLSQVTNSLFGMPSLITSANSVEALAFSPDGALLASSARERVMLWDVASEAKIAELPLPRYSWGTDWLGFTGDGQALVAIYDRDATLWTLPDRTRHPLRANPISLEDDGGRFYLAGVRALSRDRILVALHLPRGTDPASPLVVFDMITQVELHRFDAPDMGQVRVVFSPDGTKMVGYDWTLRAEESATLRVWSLAEARGERNVAVPAAIRTVAWSEDGSVVAVVAREGIHLYDAATWTQKMFIATDADVYPKIALSPDAQRVAVNRWERLLVFDASTGGVLGEFETGRDIYSLAMAPNTALAVTGSRDEWIRLWSW